MSKDINHPIGCLCQDCMGDNEPESEVVKIKIVDWMYEDEMTEVVGGVEVVVEVVGGVGVKVTPAVAECGLET